jgi:hypothetical protein
LISQVIEGERRSTPEHQSQFVRYVPCAWWTRREDSVAVGHDSVGKIVFEMVDGRGVGADGELTTCATVCFKERIKQMKMRKKEAGLDILMVVRNANGEGWKTWTKIC